ncbi:MAG: T9SS type A sorting domain-containing protein [Ignavibacteriaceae bacterium]
MNKLFVCMLVFFTIYSNLKAQWILTNGPQDVPIYSFAADGINVYAAADTSGPSATGGCVFLSTNNGEDWSNVSNGLNCGAIYSLAINDTNIFAGSVEGGVFLSTNMGANWTSVSSGLGNLCVYTLLTAPNGTGGTNLYAGTMGGGIFISTNNGGNWNNINTGLMDMYIYSLDYVQNDIFLFAGTGGNGVFVSTNNGSSWTQTALNTNYVQSLAISGENIFASTGTGRLFLSTDRGANWTDVTTGLSNLPVFALATYENNVFALTNWGNIFLSTNNGADWELINEGIIDTLVLAIGINDSYIFASGVREGIWRRPLSEIISSVQSSSELPEYFILEQNYPNPFNPTTKIRYSVPKSSNVVIKVFDILGNEIETLVNEEKVTGTYELTWYASNLPSGVYFYHLNAGEFINTKKMILLK